MRFDLVDLRLFLHVSEAASITHGAAKANMALASASERIRGMEEELGIALLERGRRGVKLTPAGRTLMHHAQIVLQQMGHMSADLAKYAAGMKGHVRLLSNTAALSEFLPEVLNAFLADNPSIDIDLEERPSHDTVRSVAEGYAEIGIVADVVDFEELETFPFATDRLVLVMPHKHSLAVRRSLSFRELLDQDFVGLSIASALQRYLAYHAMQAGQPLKLRVRLNSFDAICRMVENRVGLAIIPESAALRCRQSMAIRIAKLTDSWSLRHLTICVRHLDDLSAPARQLVQHMRQQRLAA
jgi:DNA-binding transcriptional LysR family regulator